VSRRADFALPVGRILLEASESFFYIGLAFKEGPFDPREYIENLLEEWRECREAASMETSRPKSPITLVLNMLSPWRPLA